MTVRKWQLALLLGIFWAIGSWVISAQPAPTEPRQGRSDESSARSHQAPKPTTKAERAAFRKQQKRVQVKARPLRPSDAPDLFGSVIYDPGAPADFFRTDTGAGNQIVGNVFNSAAGSPLLATGSITHFTVFPNVADGNVIISLLGPPAGTTAAPVIGFTVSGIVSNYFNQIGVAPLAIGSSFLVGQYVGTYLGPDSIGIRTATTNGQGYHAMQINYVSPAVATGFQTIPGQNAMVRLRGNLLVPVELMRFTVE